MDNAANRKLAENFCPAVSSNDIEKTMELFAPDARYITIMKRELLPQFPPDAIGYDAIRKAYETSFATYNVKLEAKCVIVDGDNIAIEAKNSAILPGGRPYLNEYVFMIKARNGKVVEVREYLDTLYTQDIMNYFASLARKK